MRQDRTLSEVYRGNRLLLVCITVTLAAAFSGFYVGVNQAVPLGAVPRSRPAAVPAEGVAPARSYLEMDARTQGVNAGWYRSTVEEMAAGAPEAPTYDDQAQLRRLKLVSLDKRNQRRAYNGAPPIVPHPVDQLSADNCMVCHADGLYLGDVVAPKMSHDFLQNCTQCHAPAPEDIWDSDAPIWGNSFVGAAPPLEGARAWIGAPPVVPHSLHMRDDCTSCHGPLGLPGLRTSHPERTNCLQCHAPSAKLTHPIDIALPIRDGQPFVSVFSAGEQ